MKKINNITIVSVFLIFFVTPVFSSDYRNMKKDFDNNDVYTAYKQTVTPKVAVLSEGKLSTNTEIINFENKFIELTGKWNKIVKNIELENSFFNFSTEGSRTIRAIDDISEIKDLLKKEIDVETLISVALMRNPALKSVKKSWESVLEKYSQATYLDNILRQYQSFIKDLNTKVGPMKHKSSISSNFPFPGTLTLKGDIITKEVEIAKEKYLITLRNLITEIESTYYELLYAGHIVHITGENLHLLKQLESVAYTKYKTGKTAYSDVIKVQTRIARLKDDEITWREYKKTVIGKLNSFLDLPVQFPLGNAKKVKLKDTHLSLEALINLGVKNQQELKILELTIAKTNLAIQLAEKKFYPDFTLGFSWFDNEKENLAGMGKSRESFSLKPVTKNSFWFGKNDAYIREARLSYQSKIKLLESDKNKLSYKIKELFFKVDTARRDVKLYSESLLILAKNNLDVSETDYQGGRVDFLDVLDAQKIWLDYNLDYQKHLRDQNKEISYLEKAVGKKLPGF